MPAITMHGSTSTLNRMAEQRWRRLFLRFLRRDMLQARCGWPREAYLLACQATLHGSSVSEVL